MRAGVPAADGEVETAGEHQGFIDDDDLLMMRRSERDGVVQAEVDLRRRLPAQSERRHRLALTGEEQRVVPQQNADLQIRSPLDQGGQERPELARQVVVRLPGGADQRGPAVDVPADDVDAVLRFQQRLAQRAVVGGGVDQHRAAVGPRHAPCVATGPENGTRRRFADERLRIPRIEPGALNPFGQHGFTWSVAAGINAWRREKCHFASAQRRSLQRKANQAVDP
jgi:hypothetical protein